jgi:NitT/TauT family transport system substrate-binding protein
MHRALVIVLLAGLALAEPAAGAEKVRIGALKLTSSAPLFVGVEKGFFQAQGIEPELVFFQAAAPIATALAAGQVDVGATGLTAALYNIVLGGERIWIVADKGREWPGYPLTAIVVQKELWDGGLRSVRALQGKRIGVTQLGSTFHYTIGNILEKEGLTLADVRIVPLQAMSTAMEALRGKQVDAILLPQPFPGTAEAQGFGKILAWTGDFLPWQVATIFYSRRFAADRERAVSFMKGYVRSARYYHDAVLARRAPAPGTTGPAARGAAGATGRAGAGEDAGAAHDEVVAITAKYTGASPAVIRLGFPYQDRDGRLLVEDIGTQIGWWVKHGFMKAALPVADVVDTSFLEAALQAVRE